MNVTRIDDYTDHDAIAALSDLLARARAGQLRGFAFVIKTAPKRHKMGFTGSYWDDPGEALIVATRMQYKLNQMISARDDEPSTDLMPL